MKNKLILFLSLILFCSFANAITPGKITSDGEVKLKKSKNIQLLQESLNITNNLITTNYTFENQSDKNIEETIVFEIPVNFAGGKDFKFKLWVDGDEKKTKEYMEVFLKEVNITKYLKNTFVSNLKGFDLNKLSDKNAKKLKELGAISDHDGTCWKRYDDMILEVDCPKIKPKYTTEGSWQKKYYVYWTQKFPANKTIQIKHQYDPQGYVQEEMTFAYRKKYREKLAYDYKALNGDYRILSLIDYKIKTSNNWKGNIKDFSLSVEAPSRAIINFEGKEIITKDKLFSIDLEDFSPTKNLNIELLYWIDYGKKYYGD